MISADFYPTVITNPVTGLEVTDGIANLQLSEPSNAYWLGWISPNNIPDSFLPSNWALSNIALTFSVIGKDSNHNIGYISMYTTSATTASVIQLYPTDPITAYNYPRYINKFDVMGGGSLDNLYCNMGVFLEYGLSADNVTNAFLRTTSTASPYNIDAHDFFNDTATIDISVQITGSSYYTKSIKYSDFNDDGYVVEETQFEESGTTYYLKATVFILGYRFGFIRDMTQQSQTGAYTNALPSIDITANDKRFVTGIAGWGTTVLAQRVNKSGAFTNALWTNGFYGNYGFINFGVNATIPLSDIAKNPQSSYAPHSIHGNVFVYNLSTSYTELYRFYTPTEIYKNYALLIRVTKSNATTIYGYNNGDNYAPYITADDEFTASLITGDLSDDDFKAKLRPWQYDVDQWADNDYTEDDLPPYEPGGDGDDQGSNTGSVLRPTTLGVGGTNGFITQYSLTAAQIAEIGRLLWLSFTDPDYYKNFLFTLTTTGTLNLSNLLDYFVSLRVYPFPLINVPSHAAAGQDMWIGAGLVPLSFNTNLHTINNYADYIDAGSCNIPRYYNDFRDFAHTQIMLYLPYCGTVQLNPADVVGSTLHAQYAVDFATGGVTAYVDCTTWDGSQFVIAVLTGSIGADIPLTASNAAQIAARIAGDALNFAGTVGEAISSDVGRSAQAIGSAATGDVVGAAIGVANTYAGRIGGALDVAQTGLQIATAEGVKMPMLSGGRGFGSFGAPQTAYVQIRRGIYAEGQQPTQGFKEAYGEAYAKPVQVSSCAGFTVFANVDTSGLQCDALEREQVKKMMQAGIYI